MPFRDFIIAVPRSFIEIAGDSDTALLLAQLDYWSLRCTNPDGWVYKSHADWKQELGLSRRLVDRARRKLVALGLIEQTCRLVRGRRIMHFRINREALREALRAIGAAERSPGRCDSAPASQDDMAQATRPDRAGTPVCTGAPGQPEMAPHANAETESTPETTAYITAEITDGGGHRAPQSPTVSECRPPVYQDQNERRFKEILNGLPAFKAQQEPDRLHELIADYLNEATSLELKKFVEYWRTQSLHTHGWH